MTETTRTARHSPAVSGGQSPQSRSSLVIGVMTLAALMDMLDVTVVNVALPTIRARLHAGPSDLEWVAAGYALAFAATLIVWGRVGDHYGRRRVFLAGVACFGVASAGAALSATPGELVVARLVEGTAAGALVPQVLATFRVSFDHDTRLKAFGIYGAVAGLAAAAGVILGGVLTQYDVLGLGWRAIFWVNVPISVLVLTVSAVVVPETRTTKSTSLDLAGGVALAACLAAIAYALLQGRSLGWPAWSFVLLAAGVAGLSILTTVEHHRERQGADTLVQVSQFRHRAFAAAISIQGLFGFGLQGFSFTFILWVQEGHHYTPLHAGLSLVAFAVGSVLTAPTAGKLAAKAGRHVLATGGALMATGSLCVRKKARKTLVLGW